jgi:hypothetical protein
MKKYYLVLPFLLLTAACSVGNKKICIVKPHSDSPRVQYGIDKLSNTLKDAGYDVIVSQSRLKNTPLITVGYNTDNSLGSEGFSWQPHDELLSVTCGGDSGILYGCMELAKRIKKTGRVPKYHFSDKPSMVLRGACIGMQKTQFLPDRHEYEYPYTPENFPFFYDKEHWRKYLDMLVENRMNTLYLWNGHPFASLVKLDDYPYALEVSEEVYQKNVEMFNYLTTEADKRGIWIVQMFYNIYVSKPFAEHHGISTMLNEPTPLLADYNRKSIAAFVRKYPNVGLLVCLGEALKGIDNQTQWFTDVIIPGVQDGMKQLGLKEEPPIILRAHATDPNVVMHAALPHYKNIYTMTKYNGESLTTYEPRGRWQQVHLNMSRLGAGHIVNVHILANLEPFRYGAPRFIQKSVQAMQTRLGAEGLHLYPLCYWNWPYSADNVEPRLNQIDRDWIWFEAWARYAWNPYPDEIQDRAYWVQRLTEMYGSEKAAQLILDAYNDAGECAPMLIRRFGITEGNRQTLSLGMTLDQLVNPEPYKPFKDLWESQSPPGERLQEYTQKEWEKQPHTGETPSQVIKEVLDYSKKAVEEIESARPFVTINKAEFDRLANDIHCIRLMSVNYAAKANAAICVLRYNYSKDINDMKKAQGYLQDSLSAFRSLAQMTRDTYSFAQSMQTKMRKIPFTGFENDQPVNYHWTQVLDKYEKELADFNQRIGELETGKSSQ